MTCQLATEIMNFLPKDLANIVSGLTMEPTSQDKLNKEIMRLNIYELSLEFNATEDRSLKEMIKRANSTFSPDDMFGSLTIDELFELHEDDLIAF
jgi:hypothetical protein